MTETEILAHAEAIANGVANPPTETDFQRAEREVRAMLADGATYSPERGWEWPA